MNYENHLLGQMLLDNTILYNTQVKPEYFTSSFTREAFMKMHDLMDKDLSIDIVTLAGVMKESYASKIATLTDLPTSGNWKFYEKEIINAYRMKQLKLACEKVLNSQHVDPDYAVETLVETIDVIENYSDFEIIDTQKLLLDTTTEIKKSFKRKGSLQGIPSGIYSLDDTTLGFQKRRLYIFGARPSCGKTALMINFIVATDRPLGVMSAESSYKELGKRLFALKGRLNGMRISSGHLSEEEFSQLMTTQDELSRRALHIYDEPNMSINTLIMKAREMKRRYNIEILYVDYLQQIQSTQKEKRHEQVADVSTKLKGLARSLDIPIVALAQLRRDSENKRPQLSDLGDSGQIERDADFAAFIYKETKRNKKTSNQNVNHWLLVLKNRDGITRDIPVEFIPKHYLFRDKSNRDPYNA